MSVFKNSNVKVRQPGAMSTLFPFLVSLFVATPLLLCVFVPTVIFFKIFAKCMSFCSSPKARKEDPEYKVFTSASLGIKPRDSRKYDAIVYGATGYTGGLLAKYFAKQYSLGKSLKWAIGGRSQARLQAVKDELVKTHPEMKDLDLVVANSSSASELEAMCRDTKVVMSTVGPYTLYGTTLVNACAVYGTDYVDITGEFDWVRDNVVNFQEMALKTGARIVSFCGHDSIPWDISCQQLASKMRSENNQSVTSFTFWDNINSKPSGGTIATVFELYERKKNAKAPVRIERKENPFYMVPGAKTGNGFTSKNLNTKMLSYDKKVQSWTGLFVMADANFRIADRSNTMLAWGNSMKYTEKMLFANFMMGYSFYINLMFLACALENSLIGWFFRSYVLPKPGEGASDEFLQKGFLNVFGEAVGEKGDKVNCVMTFDKDPGYLETARMIGESGLCFVFDNDKLKLGGGMHTTAILGDVLLDRLTATGTTFHFYNPRDDKVKSN